MIGILKKIKPCPVRHYKQSGESMDPHMKEVVSFSEYKHLNANDCYSIWECQKCGSRAYMGYGHCMGEKTSELIDDFIRGDVKINALLDRFRKCGYKFIVRHNLIKESKADD